MIGVLFKLFKTYEVDNLQAIIVNYFVCVITGTIIYREAVVTMDMFHQPWFPYALGLSFLFITIFNVVAMTVQKLGILVTTLFQKMSLVWPTIFGILIYNESTGAYKLLGLLFAFISIFLINYSPGIKLNKKQLLGLGTVLAIVTWLGSGLIEVLLYYVKIEGLSEGQDIQFTSTLFFLAGVLGLGYFLLTSIKKRPQIKAKSIIAGILLGIPNFFSIYWILVLLDRGMEASSLFPMLNVGVLVTNAAIGVLVFKESLGLVRSIGLGLALGAIVLLVL
jgi:drug/metabolite transporter (DMT)-like permease